MDTISYNKIKVSGDVNLERLLRFNIDLKLNQHGKALIVGEVSKDIAENINQNNYKNKEIIINEIDDDGEEKRIPIFSGLISNARIEAKGDFYKASIEATTGTYLLDMKKRNRSFQNVKSTYENIIEEVVHGNEKANVLCYEGEDIAIGKPIIQYMETDWEFIKRLASHLNTVLIPEHTFSMPRLMVGMPDSNKDHCILEKDFIVGLDQTYYELAGTLLGVDREDFIYYIVKSGENIPIGDKITFRNNSYIVYEKNVKLEQSEVIYTYKIGNEGLGIRSKYYNTKISGMSLLSTVLKTEGETVKLHLDIDEEQDESTAYPYKWTPTTGNMMYCMPKVGTRVSLYMSDDDEQNAKAVNCVRTNGSTCKNTSNASKRALTTEHGKILNLHPDTMGFVGNTSESSEVDSAPLKLLLDDNKGIMLQSKNNIGIYALENIEFKAPTISYTAVTGELILLQVGSEVTEDSIESPKTCISLSNYKDLYAELSKLEGRVFISYPKFDDAPQEGKFDWGQLAVNVLAGLAVVALVAATVATAGAAGFIAAGVCTSMVTGAAVCGVVSVGFVAYQDIKSGNVSNMSYYVYKGISGAVSGAVCGALGPAPGALLKEYLTKSLLAGMAGGAAGTVTDFILNKAFGEEYPVSWSDLFNNIIFGGIGGVIAGGISYKFFGAGGSDLAKRLAASNSKAPGFIRSVANENGKYTNKEILRYIGKLYGIEDEKEAAKLSINKYARMVVDNPMKLLSQSSSKDVLKLIIQNGIRESTISGIGGTDLSNYYQGTSLGQSTNYTSNKLTGFIQGRSKEDKLIDDFIYVLNSMISEDGNKISSRLENDIPQYAGGW